MTKNILIATDFSLDSLSVLKTIIKEKENAKDTSEYVVHFVTGYYTGDSIRDLLFERKETILCKIKSKEFDEACSILKNKYPCLVKKIKFDIFSGYFQRSFNQYLFSEHIEEAYYTSVKNKKRNKNIFDLNSFIKKSKNLKKQEVLINHQNLMPEKGQIAEIFA